MKALVVACLLLWAGAAQALGREVTFDEIVSSHQSQITWVVTCGSWASAGRTGVYRITHASLYAQSFLYAQWMETGQDGTSTARFTLSIPELNNDHAEIGLEGLRCQATKTGVAVRAKAYFGHEAKDGAVEVQLLQSPGAYRFKR